MPSTSTLSSLVVVVVVVLVVVVVETLDVSCHGETPLFLRKPLQQLAHIPPDENTKKLLRLNYPRLDNEWFVLRWKAKLRKQVNASDACDSEDLDDPFPPGDRRSWLKTPKLVHVTRSQVTNALASGNAVFTQMQMVSQLLDKQNVQLDKNDPARVLQEQFRKGEEMSWNLSTSGYVMGEATHQILTGLNLPKGTWLTDVLLTGQKTCNSGPQRPQPEPCDPSYRYRKKDGTCNNLKHPTWGSSFTKFRRMMPPEYGDGVSSFRKAVDGEELPSARLVSTTINEEPGVSSNCFSVLHMTFGQFLDHDLTATPLAKGVNGSSIPCCVPEVQENPKLLHPECATIDIPKDDPFYAAYGRTCMEFVRSLPANKCTFGPRDQLNEVTSYIDGSAVYGSNPVNPNMPDRFRSFDNGYMVTQLSREGMVLLPPTEGSEDNCNKEEHSQEDRFCFRAGDSRVNENVMLTVMTTLWAREHNRLAMDLKKLNPGWDDEKLYQESRRIIAAMFQHITYNEFLRGVLGPSLMTGLGLEPQEDGVWTTDYSAQIHTGICSEFATAAFRFGHSMIPRQLYHVEPSGRTTATELNSQVFHPFSLYVRGTDSNIVSGSQSQSAGKVDSSFSDQITGKLFQMRKQFGLDLIALNIQRGRDHGIAVYINVRQACGLSPVSSFHDLAQDMRPKALANLKKVYRNVADIDLFVGGLAERAVPGGQVGPTFACIIGDQFLRLKKGDRFWYENRDGPGAFTRDQLKEIHKITLARMFCDNLPDSKTILRWPLQLESAFNPKLSCSSLCIPKLDLNPWKDH